MPRILQINSVANFGSTGRISEQIGIAAKKYGYESYIAYGRFGHESQNRLIKIGGIFGVLMHGALSRLFDMHGLASYLATKRFISKIKKISPDIIHLHNIHGYYLNYNVLFRFLASLDIPIVWTFHDCWPFTGHCAHFDYIGCDRWKTGCKKCPQIESYPRSFVDNSNRNYQLKKQLFASISNLTIVPVSMWMNNLIKESFLNVHPCHVIHNGIDLNQFNIQSEYCINELRKKLGLLNEYVLLGVASVWNDRKGLLDFVKLSKIIPHNWKIVLVGLTDQQISMIPDRIIGIKRTENQQQLSTLYSLATVFVNPTYEDTYPTTNLESMACGTPVITYRTGGSPESVTDETGYVVEQGDVAGIFKCTNLIIAQNSSIYKTACRKRAEEFFNKSNKFDEYIKLYESLIKRKF